MEEIDKTTTPPQSGIGIAVHADTKGPLEVTVPAAFTPIYPDINMGVRRGTGTLLVRELFRTIQGEEPLAGRPATFIRMGGCNLGRKDVCDFCDTRFEVDKSVEMTVGDLVKAITLSGRDDDLIVLTGGEPGLQMEELTKLIDALPDREFQYESNGMYKLYQPDFPSFPLQGPKRTQPVHTVISPKAAGKMFSEEGFRLIERNVSSKYGHTYFRFVVEDKELSPYRDLPEWAYGEEFQYYYRTRCFISPITARHPGSDAHHLFDPGIDLEQSRKNWKLAETLCMRLGIRRSFQSHLIDGMR